MTNIFENPWLLIIIAVSSFFIILIFHTILPEKKRKIYFLIPLIIASSGFALDYFYKTDSERITMTIDTAVKALENENPEALPPIISENYKDIVHYNKQHFIRRARSRLKPPLVEESIWTYLDDGLKLKNNTATAKISLRVVLDPESQVNYLRIMIIRATLTLQKQNSKWLISSSRIDELNHQPFNWKKIAY